MGPHGGVDRHRNDHLGWKGARHRRLYISTTLLVHQTFHGCNRAHRLHLIRRCRECSSNIRASAFHDGQAREIIVRISAGSSVTHAARQSFRYPPGLRRRSFLRQRKLLSSDLNGPSGVRVLRTGHRSMRSAQTVIRLTQRIYMASQSSGRNSRRPRGGGGLPQKGRRSPVPAKGPAKAPVKKTFWQKVTAFFTNGNPPVARVERSPKARNGSHPARARSRANLSQSK